MNGVDIADHYSTYYCFLRKTIKWWRKLCFWLLETAVVNSFVLYKDSTKPARPNHLAYTGVQFKFSLKVPRLSSTSPAYWTSTQTSKWFGSPEAEPTASSSGQTCPVSWLCSVQRLLYAETQNTVFLQNMQRYSFAMPSPMLWTVPLKVNLSSVWAETRSIQVWGYK